MINLTKDEFAKVIHDVVQEIDQPDLTFILVTIGAMIGARAELMTEEKESDKEEHEAVVDYKAGKWNIRIATMESGKVSLCIKSNGTIICGTVVDSLYKAYNYAFNIICQ